MTTSGKHPHGLNVRVLLPSCVVQLLWFAVIKTGWVWLQAAPVWLCSSADVFGHPDCGQSCRMTHVCRQRVCCGCMCPQVAPL
jgi:hypothetical protein